jgi:two-component system chemotaxis response regulator CheY
MTTTMTTTAAHPLLVVDDDDDIRESMIDFLQDHGYAPVGAANGKDALEKLGSGLPEPCVIIMDLMMPVMDGLTFRDQQLRNPDLARIPLIIVSAFREAAAVVQDMDCAGLVAKPLDLDELLRVVREYC